MFDFPQYGLSTNLYKSTGAFAHFAPKLYENYVKALEKVFEHHPDFMHIFMNSVFPAATFNCGNTISHEQVDNLNCSGGWCAISTFGNYNHKLGSHLILFMLKLVIRFPPRSTILIPSAAVIHGNTPIQPGERCQSFVQFAPGALFRWVDCGFQLLRSLKETAKGRRQWKQFIGPKDAKWAEALGQFSKLSELEADRAAVFCN